MRPYEQRNKDTVYDHYGRACQCCGTMENLTLDHKFGTGATHRADLYGRQTDSHTIYRYIIRNEFPEDFQVLCRACNTSKSDGPACRLHQGSMKGDKVGA